MADLIRLRNLRAGGIIAGQEPIVACRVSGAAPSMRKFGASSAPTRRKHVSIRALVINGT